MENMNINRFETYICSTQYANSRNLQISGRNLPIVILLTQFDNFYIRCLLLSKLQILTILQILSNLQISIFKRINKLKIYTDLD